MNRRYVSNQSEVADSLVDMARTNPQAFAMLYREHYEAIFRYAVHRMFDRSLAEDITATVFTLALEKLNQFSGNDAAFLSWLYRIATNQINDLMRQRKRHDGLLRIFARTKSEVSYDEDPFSRQGADEQSLRLKEAIWSLKPQYQTVITLRYFEQKTTNEMAEILGLSDGTVRSQISRALKYLRNDATLVSQMKGSCHV